MQTLNLIQGTPEWHSHRSMYFNASDAPAMMGQSSCKTRTELLHELKLGLKADVSSFTQQLFDKGHRFEALARKHIAAIEVGEELFACVGVDGKLSASFDGLTLDEGTCFEHKMLNQVLRNCKCAADLPIEYRIQMQQQLMVSGATKCLFVASSWDDADDLIDKVVLWYESDLALAQQITDGWAQFERDLMSYIPSEVVVLPKTTEIMALPALSFKLIGEVQSSNLAAYQIAAESFIANINEDLQTDDDFAQAEKSVKFCKEAEDKLAQAKVAALSETASIDELLRTIDYISASLKTKRLSLSNQVKDKKESLKTQLIVDAQKDFTIHVAALNDDLTGAVLPAIPVRFAEVIKGKKLITSMQSALSDELARLKIVADGMSRTIRGNLTYLSGFTDYRYLFSDLQSIVSKDSDDFAALVTVRIAAHKEALAMQTMTQPVSVETARLKPAAQPKRHVVDLDLDLIRLPAHLQSELRDLIVFAHAHGYASDTAELEYLAGGL